MSCAKGCCETQREHYQSIGVQSAGNAEWTRTNVHDMGTHTVDVIEHFDGRQDVTVHAPRLVVKTQPFQES